MCKRKVVIISQDEYRALYEEERRIMAWNAINGTATPDEKIMPWVKIDIEMQTRRPSEAIRAWVREYHASYKLALQEHDQAQRWGAIQAMRSVEVDA